MLRMSLRAFLSSVLVWAVSHSAIGHAQSVIATEHDASADGDTSQSALGARLGFSSLMYDPTSMAKDTLRVPSPTACLVSALRQEFRATLPAPAQRARIVTRPDTIPLAPSAVARAQQCAQTWTIANTPPFEFPGLFRIDILAGHDGQAQAVGARWTQTAGTQDTARGEALLRQLQWLLETRPRTTQRIERAQHVLTELRALGPGAVEEQVDALMFLQSVANMTGAYGQQLTWVETARQLMRSIPSARQRQYFLTTMIVAIATASGDLFHAPFDLTASTLQKTVEQGLVQARRDLDTVDTRHQARIIVPTTFHDFAYAPITQRNDSLYSGMRLDTITPPVAQHWYGRPDTTVSYPRHGVMTVIMQLRMCSASNSINCEKEYVAYRQLYHEFASHGVDFIILARTIGSFGLSTVLSPSAEVDSLRHYYLEQLKLPGILGIQETQFGTLPDGRKVATEIAPMPYGIVMRNGIFWPYGAVFGLSEGFENAKTFLTNQLRGTVK